MTASRIAHARFRLYSVYLTSNPNATTHTTSGLRLRLPTLHPLHLADDDLDALAVNKLR